MQGVFKFRICVPTHLQFKKNVLFDLCFFTAEILLCIAPMYRFLKEKTCYSDIFVYFTKYVKYDLPTTPHCIVNLMTDFFGSLKFALTMTWGYR